MTIDRFFRFALAPTVAIGLLAATPVRAALVFESDAATSSSARNAGYGIMTRFEVTDVVQLTSIAIELDLATFAGNVKHVIFDSQTGALLFDSGPKTFFDDGMTFKESDPLSFSLLPGVRYAIGALVDVSSLQAYVVPGGRTFGSVTSLGGNQNANDFANPSPDLELNGTDGRVRLYGDVSSAVPVPATVPLLGLGLLAFAGVTRRRR